MKSKLSIRLVVSTLSVHLLTPANAEDFYWDANGADAGTGGAGTWDTTLALWRAGSETGALQAWTAGNVAVLGGAAGALTLGAATTADGITVLSDTTGATYTITTSASNLLGLAANAPIHIPDGKTLTFTGVSSGQVIGGSGTTFVQGGGTMTISGSNRVFLGTFDVSGAGTMLRIAGTNALDNNSWSTGLNIRDGATLEITGTNNYRRTAFLDGGTLLCGHIRSFQAQTNNILTINGTAGAKSVVANSKTGEIGGLAGNGSTARVITVNATGDLSGIDLEYQAGWRNGTFNKAGAGTMLITASGIFNRNDNYTTPNTGSNALSVSAGTVINEGTIMSPAAVGGSGLLTHGAVTGIFDQVTINAGGVFEIGRLTGLFNDTFVHAAGQSDLYLNGGTLRYAAGFSEDVSALLPAIGANGGVIDTNGNDIMFSSPLAGSGSLTKQGAGSLTLAGGHTIGAFAVNAGTLLVTGALGATAVTVAADAMIGGSGSLGGDLTLSAGAKFRFDPLATLTVSAGTVSFGGFGIGDLVGLDGSVAEAAYTLIQDTGTAVIDFTHVGNLGIANAAPIGGGKFAYLEPGSLRVVVIPEPSALWLCGLGLLAMGCRRRR